MQMTACECFFPDSGDSFVIQRDPAVLPPDNATLRLAEYAARDIATVQRVVGPLFARATDNESLVPTEANIVDLGSGTGVLGIAAVKKVIEYDGVVASLTAVEIDEGASDNTTANYRTHINHPYPAIKAEVLRASWDEERVWDAIANADVILCNPPYLIPDDSTRIRKGFESVNPIAMYGYCQPLVCKALFAIG